MDNKCTHPNIDKDTADYCPDCNQELCEGCTLDEWWSGFSPIIKVEADER